MANSLHGTYSTTYLLYMYKTACFSQVSYAGSVPLRSNSTQAFTYAGNPPPSDDGSGSGYGGGGGAGGGGPEYHVGRRYSHQEVW